MTTLSDRPHTALLVIDVQNGVVAGAHNRDGVIANINTLIDKARSADVPVVWVQHSDEELTYGSENWQYVPELKRQDDEPVVHKEYADSFEGTDLESVLAERKVGRLLVTGAQTDVCVRSTLHGAIVRGYDATLVADAHTTEDLTKYGVPAPAQVIAHTNFYGDGTAHQAGRAGPWRRPRWSSSRCLQKNAKEPQLAGSTRSWGSFSKFVRRRPTLPQGPPCSTIGAVRLSFRVRNVTGRFPHAMTTETL